MTCTLLACRDSNHAIFGCATSETRGGHCTPAFIGEDRHHLKLCPQARYCLQPSHVNATTCIQSLLATIVVKGSPNRPSIHFLNRDLVDMKSHRTGCKFLGGSPCAMHPSFVSAHRRLASVQIKTSLPLALVPHPCSQRSNVHSPIGENPGNLPFPHPLLTL